MLIFFNLPYYIKFQGFTCVRPFLIVPGLGQATYEEDRCNVRKSPDFNQEMYVYDN